MTPRFLPYGRQTIEDDDVAAVAAALRADFLTTGPAVERFEQDFAQATGATHAVACNSGTAALHLAALALDLGPGDAAIVPAMTFLATANVVRMTGAEVVFADVDPDSGLMTPETFGLAVQQADAALKLKAAAPVHLNGQICDMAGLAALAAKYGVELFEDACHALGVDKVGANAFSKMACFSTHPVKAIATGEGGVVTTRDAAVAERARRLRSHGMSRDSSRFKNGPEAFDAGQANPWYYEMTEIGWNYRLPDVLCALGSSQIKKLNRFWHRRVEIAALYDKLLAPLAPVIRPAPYRPPHGWHLYVVLCDFAALGVTRARAMKALRDKGVGSQVHYIPVNRQPYYRERYGDSTLPGAERYYARCLSLPIFPTMSDDDVHRAASAVADLATGRL